LPLINCEHPYIYVEKENIIYENINETINSRESKYVLYSKAGATLYDLGYHEISKYYGGIYFCRYKISVCSYGIMYYSNGFDGNENSPVVHTEELKNYWYYFKLS
jgi:hypothetical protein